RRQRPRLVDRLRPRAHAHPRHRLARGQPAPAAALAAEAARPAQRGGGGEGLLAPAPRLRAVLEPGLLRWPPGRCGCTAWAMPRRWRWARPWPRSSATAVPG